MGLSIRTTGLSAGAALSALVLNASTANAQLTVFMDGLANPRGLTFNGNTLYVSEAGSGGPLPAYTGGDGEAKFYGATGAVSRKTIGGPQELYLVDLPSAAGAAGFGATGPQDVQFDSLGRLNVTIGLGANPNVRQTAPLSNQVLGGWLGTIVRQEAVGFSTFDVAGLEAANDFDGAGPDSNPFGLGIAANGTRVVADAGANAVTAIAADGSTRTVAFAPRPNPLPFGPPTFQSVPNGLTIGPDGDAYVVELTGAVFPPGAARIFRIDLDAPVLSPVQVATGFTNLIDLAFAADGTLYALEVDADSLIGPGDVGALYRVNGDGSRTLVLGDLASPTGLTVGPDGAFYISATGLSPTDGQVLRYVVPEPATLAALGLTAVLLRRRRA